MQNLASPQSLPTSSDGRLAEISPEDLAPIQALYDRGLCRQAYDAAERIAPMRSWTGLRPRILAGRIAMNLGAQRLGRVMQLAAYRDHRDKAEARAYFVAAVIERFGLWSAWQWLKRFGEMTPSDDRQRDAVMYLHSQRARIAATWRDFETADDWLRRAEAIDPGSPWLFTERSFLLEQQDRYEEALETAHRSLQAREWYRPGIQTAAHILQILDRDDEALDLLTKAVQRVESVPVLHQLASLQINLQQYEKARETLDALAALSPILEEPFHDWLTAERAAVAYHCGQFDVAAEHARSLPDAYHKQFAERLAGAATHKRKRLTVSFVRQHHMTCAPATLSALCRFWNRPAEHLAVAEEICYDGTPSHSERRWAAENGWHAREFMITWDAAVALLDRGIPFTITTVEAASAHLQAVIGYDTGRGTLLIRDPFNYYVTEVIAENFLKRYAASGPRGMLLVPVGREDLLNGVPLPDVALYDLFSKLQSALAAHRRAEALSTLSEMQSVDPQHRLTLTAQRTLAGYDANVPALREAVEALLKAFPDDPNLLLTRLNCLRELAPQQERVTWLREICEKPPDPLFFQQYAEELKMDAREAEHAAHWLKRAVRFRPVDSANLMSLGDAFWSQNDFAAATECYRFAACIDDKREYPALTYFNASRAARATESALNFLRHRCERYGKKSGGPVTSLFEGYRQLDRWNEGFAALDRAVTERPEDGDLLLFAAIAHARQGRLAVAKELLGRAESRAHRAALLRARAELCAHETDHTGALALWRELTEIEPLSVSTCRATAAAVSAVEGNAAAVKWIESRCAAFPHHVGLHQVWLEWLRDDSPENAAPVARRLVEIAPLNAWAHRELALVLSRCRRFSEALEHANIALRLAPTVAASHSVRGWVHESNDELRLAADDFRAALRLAVDTGDAIDGLLNCCHTLVERREALAFIEQELIRQVVFGDGLLAFRYQARGILEPDALLTSLQKALTARPDLWHAWSAVVNQLIDMQQFDEAAQTATRATERFPVVPRLWLDAASAHFGRLDFAAEVAAIERALELSPMWNEPAQRLANTHRRLSAFPKARQVLENATARLPSDPSLEHALAELLWDMGERSASIERLKRTLQLNPGDDGAWHALRYCSLEIGQPALAVDFGRELTRTRSGEARSWLYLATMMGETPDEMAEAHRALDKAIELNPACSSAYDLRAELLVRQERFDEALQACAPKHWGEHLPVELSARAAWVHAQRGDLTGAIAAMKQVVADNPRHYWGWQQLADWHWRREEFDEAVNATTQMARLTPMNAVPLGYRAELKLRRKDRAGAKQDFARAVKLDPAYRFAVFSLIDLLLEDKELEDAAALIQQVRPHVDGDDIDAAEVRLIACRRQEGYEQAPAEEIRKVTAAGEDIRRALELLKKLCFSKAPAPRALNAAYGALRNASFHVEAFAVLDEAAGSPEAHPEVGALWMQQRLEWKRSPRKKLAQMLERGEIGKRAVLALIRHRAETKRRSRLRFVIWKHRHWLRHHEDGFQTVLHAYVRAGLFGCVLKWVGDWQSRRNLPMWALYEYAFALRGLGREEKSHPVVAHALTLPNRDDTYRELRLLFAAEEAMAGRTESAAAAFKDIGEEGWDEYRARLYRFVRGMIEVQQAVTLPEKREAFRRARAGIDDLLRGFSIARSDIFTRRDYRRYLTRMARDSASWFRIVEIWFSGLS
jgi:cellulose synthase operon protein C